MSEYEFVTHMTKSFTDKYGQLFASFFVNESIHGKYLSAKDLYNMLSISDDVILLDQSNFIREFEANCKAARKIYGKRFAQKNELTDFFKSSKVSVAEGRNSEKSYWETLFAYVHYMSKFNTYSSNNMYSDVLNRIVVDKDWYNESIFKNIVWSMEFFRLRLFVEDISDDAFDFLHMLDWFDILEFRILPVAFKMVISELADVTDREITCSADDIISLLKQQSDYPFAERIGVEKQSNRKALWNIRKNMFPNKRVDSDVNLPEDIEIFKKITTLIRKRTGVDNTPIEKKEQILVYTSERNRFRQRADSNGTAYFICGLSADIDFGLNDSECIDSCLSMFKELTADVASLNIQDINAVIGIHHLLYHEILDEEKEDLQHPHLSELKYDLEYTYRKLQREILESVFTKYSKNKSLLLDIRLCDEYQDELLAEMIMRGSHLLVKNEVDSLLEKIFNPAIETQGVTRNSFINQAWNSLDYTDRSICFLHASDIGLLERINRVGENDLSGDERKYAEMFGELWTGQLKHTHETLQA